MKQKKKKKKKRIKNMFLSIFENQQYLLEYNNYLMCFPIYFSKACSEFSGYQKNGLV